MSIFKEFGNLNSDLYLKIILGVFILTVVILLSVYTLVTDQSLLSKLESAGSLGSAIAAFTSSFLALYLSIRGNVEKIKILIYSKKYNHDYICCRLQNNSSVPVNLIRFELIDQNGKEISNFIDTGDPNKLYITGNNITYEEEISSYMLTREFNIAKSLIKGKQCQIIIETSGGSKFNQRITGNFT